MQYLNELDDSGAYEDAWDDELYSNNSLYGVDEVDPIQHFCDVDGMILDESRSHLHFKPNNGNKHCWLLKSKLIIERMSEGKECSLIMPRWFAESKKLI